MIIKAFGGAAGTGKTTRLMTSLQEHLAMNPLQEGQRLLALTRMHGSRIRLTERLTASAVGNRFDCHTFDRFAWELTSRWRSLLRERGLSLPSEFEYDQTCEAAAALLEVDCVARWVVARYPIILVDEFQDCWGGRLDIVRRLLPHAGMLIAADHFQDLSNSGENNAAIWLQEQTGFEELTIPRRTTDACLINAAQALRLGTPVIDGTNIRIFQAQNPAVAASFLARGISWSAGQEVVVISANSADTSSWVRDTLTRLSGEPFRKAGRQYGPYHVQWEQSREGLEGQLQERLGLPSDEAALLDRPRFAPGTPVAGQEEIERWIQNQYRLRGQAQISCAELQTVIRRTVQHLRSHSRPAKGLRAMTIHQAKNREFEKVLILWSVQIKNDPELQRRLLYNAVTRAKQSATVIVQDPIPKNSRLWRAPFFRAAVAS